MHGDGLADDEAILDELADGLAGVGVGNLAGLVGVEPDLALSATDHGGREALLCAEVDPIEKFLSVLMPMCKVDDERVPSGKEGFATSRVARRAQRPGGRGHYDCEMACRGGLECVQSVFLTFSMMLSSVVEGC